MIYSLHDTSKRHRNKIPFPVPPVRLRPRSFDRMGGRDLIVMTTLPQSKLTNSQVKTYGPKTFYEDKRRYSITVEVRYDDECGNGHNSFAITADIRENDREYMGGCCHEEVARHFPELAPFIKWHLCASDGPMRYIANTVYHAGDRDYNGLRKGEFQQHTSRGTIQNGGVAGVPNWVLELPKVKDVYANEKPAPVTLEWRPYGRTGEGQERNLASARSSAIWPEATDEQLCSEPEELKRLLVERLPALIEEFKAAVESLGFVF